MATTSLTITASEQLASFLDSNADQIDTTQWDESGDVLTITLLNGDVLELTYSPVSTDVGDLTLTEFHETVCWPKRVTKGNGVVTTETFSPLEILKAQQEITSRARTGKFRRYTFRSPETRACACR